MGLVLAAGPADPLQPRLRRPARAGPWSERKALVWWDEAVGRWVGNDIADFPDDLPPGHVPPPGAVGPAALRGDDAFVLQADGKAWLFAPNGVLDGPLPTHYEPDESPVVNPLHGPRASPTRRLLPAGGQPGQPGGRQRGLPVRAHRLPAHRALHRGRHDAAGCRSSPSCSRSCSSRCRRSSRPRAGWSTTRGATCHQPHRGAGQGDRDRADPRRCGCRAGSCTRSGCPTTSVRAGSPPAT